MRRIHIRKRFLLIMLCTILLTFLCAPIYSDNAVFGWWKSRYDNKTARADIQNLNNANKPVKILSVKAPSWHNIIISPRWQQNGNLIENTISSKWRSFTIKFEAINDGKVAILWRGPYFMHNNKQYPVPVDFRFVTVNGKHILDGRQAFTFNNPLKHKLSVKKGEVVTISFEARKHHWRFSDLRRFYAMNWLLFFSVLILAFLLSYKLVQYVSKFKLAEHNSRIDIVFVITFLALLFVPMSRISTAEKSMQENRMLAKYPNMFEKTLNQNYGKQFEQWFNDRFNGRDFMISAYSRLKLAINRVYKYGEAILIKDNNWTFNGNFTPNIPSSQRKIINGLKEFKEFLRQNNIRFYMMIVPPKSFIYREYLLEGSDFDYKKFKALNQWVKKDLVAQNSDLNIVYLYNMLRKARHQDFVFFKQTHHWTDWGAYNGYQELMKVIAKDYPDIHIVHLDEYKRFTSKFLREDSDRKFHTGQTLGKLKIDKEYAVKHLLKDDYVYYDHNNMIEPKIVNKDYRRFKFYKNNNLPNAPRVMVVGTSQNEDFMQFLPYSFSELRFFRMNNVKKVPYSEEGKIFKRFKKDILELKPDIFILSVTTGNLPQLAKIMED